MIRRLHDRTGAFARKYPAVLMCGAACAVILPVLLSGRTGFSFAFLLVLTAVWFFPLRTGLFRIAIPAALTAFSLVLHAPYRVEDPLLRYFSGSPGYAVAEVRITDESLSTGLAFLKPPYSVRAQVRSVTGLTGERVELISDVMLVAPYDERENWDPGYGDVYRVSGTFRRPAPPLTADDFDYRQWLERQGIYYELRSDSLEKKERGCGLLRGLYDIRSWLLNRVCARITPENARDLAPGLFFGIRSADAGTKQDFLKSGMIHILSVSGTHVTLFAGVLFVLLCFLPYRWRYLSVIALTFLYTASTGMRVPAFRAFVMFALFFGLRAFQLRTITLNTLFLTAFILLVLDPVTLFSTGFQFSFLVVAALLLTSEFQRRHPPPPGEELLLTPSRWIEPGMIRRHVFGLRLRQMIAGCLVAWLVSLPLSLLYQGMLPAGSPVANFLAIPVVLLGFFFFFLTGLFSFVPLLSGLFSWFLSLDLELICLLAETFAAAGAKIATPGLFSVIGFLLLLFLFLAVHRKWIRILCPVCLLLLCLWWCRGAFDKEETILLFSDGTAYSICVIHPENASADILFLPDMQFAAAVFRQLRSHQVNHCTQLFLQSSNQDCCSAETYLRERFPVLKTLPDDPGEPHPPLQIFRTDSILAVEHKNELYFQIRKRDGTVFSGMIRKSEPDDTLTFSAQKKSFPLVCGKIRCYPVQ